MLGIGKKTDVGTEYTDTEKDPAAGIPVFWSEVPDQKSLKDAMDMDLVDGERTDRTDMYKLYEEYYGGNQKSELSARAAQYLSQQQQVEYAENVCDLVVDAMADRLTIKGFENGDTEDDLGKTVEKTWDANNMVELTKTAFSRTIELGDGFYIVDWNPATKTAEIHFNQPNIVKAEYHADNAQKMCRAIKVWDDNKVGPCNPNGANITRMNIYYENRIERYFTIEKQGDFSPWWDEGNAYWPLPWTRDNEPSDDPTKFRGIPVFHLKNKSRGGTYGVSELHKVVPLQNSLNKLWLDLFEISDAMGFPQRWGAGISDTQAKKLKSGSASIWTTSEPTAKFGQFDAADLNQVVDVIDSRYRSIAGTTGTPIHLLVLAKGILSGEALKKSEAPLVAKVKDRQPGFAHQTLAAMNMAMTLEVDNGNDLPGYKPGETRMTVIWNEAENVDELERMEVAESKRRVGVPLRKVLQEIGYTKLDEIMKMVEDELKVAAEINGRAAANSDKTTAVTTADKNADGKKTPTQTKAQLQAGGRDVKQ